jgi:hypothetical protein
MGTQWHTDAGPALTEFIPSSTLWLPEGLASEGAAGGSKNVDSHPKPHPQGYLGQLRSQHFHTAFHSDCLLFMRYPTIYSFSPDSLQCEPKLAQLARLPAVLLLGELSVFSGPGLSPLGGSCFVYTPDLLKAAQLYPQQPLPL